MPAAVDLRLLRAAVFAAACVALAAAGHLSAGPGVAPAALLAGWLAVLAVTAPLAGRERGSLPAMAGLLAVCQILLHCLFALGRPDGGHAVDGTAAHGQQPAGPAQGALALAARLLCADHAAPLTTAEAEQVLRDAGLTPLPPGTAAASAAGPAHLLDRILQELRELADAPMLLGHLLAALAAGWLLRRGEAALWRLLRLSRSACTRAPLPLPRPLKVALTLARTLGMAGPLPEPVAGRPRRRAGTRCPAGTSLLAEAVTRRGPPFHVEPPHREPGHPVARLALAA
ncbi:hypothetical protein [Streptomyces sp. YIM 98790]|uniref:hypothetical protein n=1 Tax=Streptomyces sp. YIM 98790 TaxID=2689077 RepID=UPI001A9E4226|nr:hypothetical protein [Streptomyces sp. YIM 98790]